MGAWPRPPWRRGQPLPLARAVVFAVEGNRGVGSSCAALFDPPGCALLMLLILRPPFRGLFSPLPLLSGGLPSFLADFSVITTGLSSLLPCPPLIFCFDSAVGWETTQMGLLGVCVN